MVEFAFGALTAVAVLEGHGKQDCSTETASPGGRGEGTKPTGGFQAGERYTQQHEVTDCTEGQSQEARTWVTCGFLAHVTRWVVVL